MISKLAARSLSALLLLGCGGVHAAGWLETKIAVEEFVVTRDYDAAVALGEELLTQAEAEFGPASTQLYDAHQLLASIHRRQANFADAELHMLRAIDVLEARDGAQATTLIQPLITLGETYFQAGDYELSLATFEEARGIGRRVEGLLNPSQIEIVERMSVVAYAMGDPDKARDLQREVVAIVQRTHGTGSVEYIDAQFRLASWFIRVNQFEDARRTFLEVQRVIREEFADDPLLSISMLRASATAVRNADPAARYDRTAPTELQKALDIVLELDEPDPILHAEILRDIGDWYVSLSIPTHIATAYAESWAILDSAENGSQRQRQWFTPLTLIRAPRFQSRIFSSEPDAPWGRVELAFKLDTQGRATEVRVTQSDPPGLIDQDAIRQIVRSRFRPRMQDGRLIVSEAIVGWDFQYDPAVAESEAAIRAGRPSAP